MPKWPEMRCNQYNSMICKCKHTTVVARLRVKQVHHSLENVSFRPTMQVMTIGL